MLVAEDHSVEDRHLCRIPHARRIDPVAELVGLAERFAQQRIDEDRRLRGLDHPALVPEERRGEHDRDDTVTP